MQGFIWFDNLSLGQSIHLRFNMFQGLSSRRMIETDKFQIDLSRICFAFGFSCYIVIYLMQYLAILYQSLKTLKTNFFPKLNAKVCW